jgi:hypothetical protein
MKNGLENIKEILSKYFEGNADEEERKRAEAYLISHPEMMENFEDIWNLRLNPFSESADIPGRLLRDLSDLDDNQILLLAAAAEEGDLSSESLSDLDAILESAPGKKSIIAGFHNLKLKPLDDRWHGRNRMLRTTPGMLAFRKGVIVTLAAAAMLTAVLFLGPAQNDIMTPAGQALSLAKNSDVHKKITGGKIAEKITPVMASPSITSAVTNKTPRKKAVISPITKEKILPEKEETIEVNDNPAKLPQIAYVEPALKNPEQAILISDLKTVESSGNWMLNGISAVASALGIEDKPKDSFTVAGEGIKGINKLLGWNMRLEKETGTSGELLAVNFKSDLLSFSKPVKKNTELQ